MKINRSYGLVTWWSRIFITDDRRNNFELIAIQTPWFFFVGKWSEQGGRAWDRGLQYSGLNPGRQTYVLVCIRCQWLENARLVEFDFRWVTFLLFQFISVCRIILFMINYKFHTISDQFKVSLMITYLRNYINCWPNRRRRFLHALSNRLLKA